MRELLTPKLEGLLQSLASLTQQRVECLGPDAPRDDASASYLVESSNGETFGYLAVFSEFPVAPAHDALYEQLSRILGDEIELREQAHSLENRFRLVDKQNAELAAMNRALAEMAYRDPLTNLYRRWYLVEQFRIELTRATRYGRPFSVLLIDLDDFDRVNEKYGHAAGDAALRTFSHLLQSSCRTSDVLANFGGDVFCALLTDTPLEGAAEVAERIRRRCAEELFHHGTAEFHLTASMGVGSYGEGSSEGLTVESILEQVERLMHRAKHDGKNRIELASAAAPA